jgi:hypothetical protein
MRQQRQAMATPNGEGARIIEQKEKVMPGYPIEDLPRTAADPITAHMFLGIAIYGMFAGAGFVMMGLRGRQRWMVFWGGGLVLSSIAYLVSRMF